MSKFKKLSCKIDRKKTEIAEKTLKKHYQKQPELKEIYNKYQEEKYLEDVEYTLAYLSEALYHGKLKMFINYSKWLKVFLLNIDIKKEHILAYYHSLNEILEKDSAEDKNIINNYFNKALQAIEETSNINESLINEDNPQYKSAIQYLEYCLNSERKKAINFILDLIKNKISVKEIYLNIFQPVQHEIGRLWQINKISVAEEHFCTSVTQLAMAQLYPYILNDNREKAPCITTCVGDELHELGIRMLADLLEMEGYNTIHLGANTPANSIISKIDREKAALIGISVTLPLHTNKAENLIRKIKSKYNQIIVLVGGYVFNNNPGLWKDIGADGFAANALDALDVIDNLLLGGD